MKGTGYLVQATLILTWWLALIISDDFFRAFQFPGIDELSFYSFFAPDVLVVALLSVIRAYRSIRELEFIILGGFAFAAIYCINALVLTGGGLLPTTLMILGLCYNFFLVFNNNAFRTSKSRSTEVNGAKTIFQIICVWLITLAFFPGLILKSLNKSLVPEIDALLWIALLLLIMFSLLGLTSALTMVVNGQGTPLPIDQTNKLVTNGAYNYVRNPMAIAGIGQALSISLAYKSLPIFIYVLLGAMLWQFVVRPLEEKDMLDRFGTAYEVYREKVPLWIPKLRIY